MVSGSESTFGPVIFYYSRANAIADGVLIDVTNTASQAGFVWPVAVTRAVWGRYVEFEPNLAGQSESGRLWDILWMLHVSIKRARSSASEIQFQLHVAMNDRGNWQSNEDVPEWGSGLRRETHRLVTLKAVIGPGDTPAPVITIMLPGED